MEENDWQPKNGDEVRASNNGSFWITGRFIGMNGDLFVCSAERVLSQTLSQGHSQTLSHTVIHEYKYIKPQFENPFRYQEAAENIIKISCNKDTPYADKMNMVVQAILEFERNPNNKQPKNEKA